MTHSKNLLGHVISALSGTSPSRRRARQEVPKLDSLEGRVVLSGMSPRFHFLMSHLSAGAQVSQTATTASTGATGTTATTPDPSDGPTGPADFKEARFASGMKKLPSNPSAVKDATLAADLKKLSTDRAAAVSGSASSTATDRSTLFTDLRTIEQSGVTSNKTILATAADNLLTALADGSYDANATTAAGIKSTFTSAFTAKTGATLDPTAISNAYDAFVTVARDLNLSTTQLGTLTQDRSNIEADLTRLGITTTNNHGPGQSSNLDLILEGGRGHEFGHGFGPGFGGGSDFRSGHRGMGL